MSIYRSAVNDSARIRRFRYFRCLLPNEDVHITVPGFRFERDNGYVLIPGSQRSRY